MNIGEAARLSGVPAKRIRYYERIGLLPEPARATSGYRSYAAADVHRLRLIRIAQSVGVSFDELRELLHLWRDGRHGTALRHHLSTLIEKLDQRRSDVHTMIAELHALLAPQAPRPKPPARNRR